MPAQPEITPRALPATPNEVTEAATPLRRRRRFVPRDAFATLPRTAPALSPEAFRSDQDATAAGELDDPYAR